eukprot:gene7609-biopygen22555
MSGGVHAAHYYFAAAGKVVPMLTTTFRGPGHCGPAPHPRESGWVGTWAPPRHPSMLLHRLWTPPPPPCICKVRPPQRGGGRHVSFFATATLAAPGDSQCHVLQLPPAMVERVGVGSGGGSCVVVALAAVAEATVAAAVAQLSGSTIPLVPILHCACSGARAAPLWGGGCAPRRAAPRRSAPGGACGRRGRVERQGMEHQLATPGENCVQSP